MREMFFRKELVVGIIFLFLGASISPVLGASLITHKESSDVDIFEGNELIEDESSEMMMVTRVKLLENGFIRNFQEKMSVKDYNDYVEKISACECGDVESSFAVLKEYGIVPESMVIDQFVQIMNKKTKKLSSIINLINHMKQKPKSRESIECFLTVAIFEINPVSYNVYIPLIIFRANSNFGGKITACGQSVEWGEFIDIRMGPYLGILVTTPYVCLIKTTYAGFASIFAAYDW